MRSSPSRGRRAVRCLHRCGIASSVKNLVVHRFEFFFGAGTGASQNQAAQTFRSQDIDGDGVISWHEFDGPKTGPMGVDVKSLKDEP